MRFLLVPMLLIAPAFAPAQPPDAGVTAAALRYVGRLYDPATGGYRPTPTGGPRLRATNAGVKATKYLGGKPPDEAKTRAFVGSCFDPAAGGFADVPGGKPEVTTTAVGVMAAVETGVPRATFAAAMGYLKANAKTFEEVRLGAAAVEAWGLKDCPFALDDWIQVANRHAAGLGDSPPQEGRARAAGSLTPLMLRLGQPCGPHTGAVLRDGQRADGGWGKEKTTGSDAETTYRVMRALHMLKQRPNDPAGVRKFLASCRNPDGGFGTVPGEPSGVSGVYYYAIVTHWLGDRAK